VEPLKFGIELRLQGTTFFGRSEALGRVGAIAWNENKKTEVQIITGRLQAIQEQLKSQPSTDLNLCDRWQPPMSK